MKNGEKIRIKGPPNVFKYTPTNYRGFSSYANFISANFITAVYQNFPKIFALCVFSAIHFITAIFMLR